jgi:hypothetical protein
MKTGICSACAQGVKLQGWLNAPGVTLDSWKHRVPGRHRSTLCGTKIPRNAERYDWDTGRKLHRSKKVSNPARPLAVYMFTLAMVERFIKQSPTVAARLLVKLTGDPLDYWQATVKDSPGFAAGYIFSSLKQVLTIRLESDILC